MKNAEPDLYRRARRNGVPNIFSVWEEKGWKEPVIEEQYGPDRTRC
jgi:hypothetical protein